MRTLRITVVLALVVSAVLVMGGCVKADADPAKLEGAWKLEAFGGIEQPEPADATVDTNMTMKAGQVAGLAGVNNYNGSYEAPEAGKLTFGPLATTMMAGPDAAMKQEQRFLKALADTKTFEFNGDKLVLGDAGNNTLAIMVPK